MSIVVDAGIALERNLEMLRSYGYDYICVVRCKPISEKVIERIGRIKERNSAITKYYLINVKRDDESEKSQGITWEFSDIEKMNFNYSGSYFLKTSRQDLDEKELWDIYSNLNTIEAIFRSLKSELAFRPVFHRKEDRADSHLFMAVLAYHLLNSIRIRLLEKDIHISWQRLRKLLSTHTSVTTIMKTDTGKCLDPTSSRSRIFSW